MWLLLLLLLVVVVIVEDVVVGKVVEDVVVVVAVVLEDMVVVRIPSDEWRNFEILKELWGQASYDRRFFDLMLYCKHDL